MVRNLFAWVLALLGISKPEEDVSLEARRGYIMKKGSQKGVYKMPNGRYRAKLSIRFNSMTHTKHLGMFDTIEEAVARRNEYIESLK